MEVLKEVLIKECGGMIHDKVFIVENLPKKFIFEKTVKMVPRKDKEGYMDGTVVPDPKGEMIDTVYNGIEMSPTGDNGFVFWKDNQESSKRLMDIDRYIDRTLPRDTRIPERIPYSQQVGNAMANPISYHQIPRVTLPIERPEPVKSIVPETIEVPEPQEEAMAVAAIAESYPSAAAIRKQSKDQKIENLRAKLDQARERMKSQSERGA